MGRGREGEAEVFELNLRDADGAGAEVLVQERADAGAVDAEAGHGAGQAAGRAGAVDAGLDGIAGAGAELAFLAVRDAQLNGVDEAHVRGVERKVEGGAGAEKDAGERQAAVVAEDAQEAGKLRARNGAGGEKELKFCEGVGVGVAGEGDEVVGDRLRDERLVAVDEILRGGRHGEGARRGGQLDANIVGVAFVDLVEGEVEEDVGAAVDEVGEGGVDMGEGVLVAAKDERAGVVYRADHAEVEDVAGEVGVLGKVGLAGAGEEEGFFNERHVLHAVFGGVVGEEELGGLERHAKGVGQGFGGAKGVGEGDVVKVEAKGGAGVEGVYDLGADAVGLADLEQDVLGAGAEMEVVGAWGGGELDGAGEGEGVLGAGGLRGIVVGSDDWGLFARREVLKDDGVLGVDRAGLHEEAIGLFVVAVRAGLGGALDKVGEVVLAGDGESKSVVAVERIELGGAGEIGLGLRVILVLEGAGTAEKGVVGFAALFRGDVGCRPDGAQ